MTKALTQLKSDWLDAESKALEIKTNKGSASQEFIQAIEASMQAANDYQAALNDETKIELTGEGSEINRLKTESRVGHYVRAAIEGRAVKGRELELNAALGIPENELPLQLLAPAQKATTDTDTAAGVQPWVDRLFSETAAMYLGVSFVSAMPGTLAVPVITAGASAAQRGRGQAAAAAAWTAGVSEIKPTRSIVRADFSNEDMYRLPGLEDALRRDLTSALTEGVDRAIFVGDAGANENTADIAGLQGLAATAAGLVEVTITQANKAKGPDNLAAFSRFIDGRHASEMSDLRVLASVGANTLWLSSLVDSDADSVTVAEFLRRNGLMWRVRGDVETATAAGDFAAFIGKQRGMQNAGVAAIWASAQLIRDPYSEAAKGEVSLTLATYWGLAFPRPSNFARLKYVA